MPIAGNVWIIIVNTDFVNIFNFLNAQICFNNIINRFMQKPSCPVTPYLALAGLCGIAYALYKGNQKNNIQIIQEGELLSIEEILKQYSNDFANSKAIQKIIPRMFNNQKDLENLTNNLYYRKQNSHLNSLTKSLSQPIWDLLDRGGKRWRPVLCMLIAELYGHKKEEVYQIAALCQIIHNGTLIVDDIEDSSTVRRDRQCVHLLYGVDISINAGNFMYFAPLNYLIKCGKFTTTQIVKIGQIYAEEMTNLHIGQGWDILWHNIDKLQGNYPSQNDYLQMTAHKTGVLARLSSRLVCTFLDLSKKQTEVLARFAQTMGVAFQIQDDLLNLEGQEFIKTKGYNGQDIHQGKITLMVLHYLAHSKNEKSERLVSILGKKTTDKDQINEAISILRQGGCLEYARQKMNELINNSMKEIQEILPNNRIRHYLKQLSYFGIKRTK